MLEGKIQSDIVKYLQYRKIFFYSVPNEAAGKNAKIRMSQLKAMGLRAGASDLVLPMKGGLSVYLEVKRDKKSIQSKAQINFENKLKSLGHTHYYVVRSISDVEEALDDFYTSSGG